MELWHIIDSWLIDFKHLLPHSGIRVTISAYMHIAYITYGSIFIIAIRDKEVEVMPPNTEYYTISIMDHAFWNKLLAGINRCVEEIDTNNGNTMADNR
jgi:hypothetical protein